MDEITHFYPIPPSPIVPAQSPSLYAGDLEKKRVEETAEINRGTEAVL